MTRAKLHAVPDTPEEPKPEDMLAELVPELLAAERAAAVLRGRVGSWRVALAKKRRVAFIRDEHVRREFA